MKNGKIHKKYQLNIHLDDTIDIVKKKNNSTYRRRIFI